MIREGVHCNREGGVHYDKRWGGGGGKRTVIKGGGEHCDTRGRGAVIKGGGSELL